MQPGTPARHAAASIDNDGFHSIAIRAYHPQKFTLGNATAAPDTGPQWLTLSRCHRRNLSHRLHSRLTRP